MAEANGIKIHYAIYGSGSPVIFPHGGLANSDYWGNQVPTVAARHTVILMDSRGHGRSTRDARPYGYDLMVDDVVALMDALKISKAPCWSRQAWRREAPLSCAPTARCTRRFASARALTGQSVPPALEPDLKLVDRPRGA
jgi:alpha-beta hydrolase superfamily lysophospholipase